jgi:hypothetical protein
MGSDPRVFALCGSVLASNGGLVRGSEKKDIYNKKAKQFSIQRKIEDHGKRTFN